MMRKVILIAGICFLIFVALVSLTAVGAVIATSKPAPTPIQAQTVPQPVSGDTASIYFSDLYQTEGVLPLHTWQPITVYGETFPACVVDIVGSRSTLTVNPTDSQICGSR